MRVAMWREKYAPRSYFFKLFSSIGLVMVTMIVMLAYTLFGRFSQYSDKSLQALNANLLAQISYNVQYTSDYINQLLLTLYSRPETDRLLGPTGQDTLSTNRDIINLDQTFVSAPFIDSVYLYNGSLRQFYVMGSERFIRSQLELDDPEAVAWSEHPAAAPQLKPIYRQLTDRTAAAQAKSVFTYVMYVPAEGGAAAPRMIIVNVKADWVMNNISAMSKSRLGPNSIVYIVDRSGHLVEAGQRQADSEQLRASCLDTAARAAEGQYWCKTDKAEYSATVQSIPELDWKLLVLTTNRFMAGEIRELKTVTIAVSGLLIVLGLLVSLLVARYLHVPIRRLKTSLSAFLGDKPAKTGGVSELKWVSHMVGLIKDDLTLLQNFKSDHLQTLKIDLLKKLLTHPVEDERRLEPLFEQLHIRFPAAGRYAVVLVKVDHLTEQKRHMAAEQWEHSKRELTGMLEHALAGLYRCEAMEWDDQWVAVLQMNEDLRRQPITTASLCDDLSVVQQQLEKAFAMSVSVFISHEGHGLASLRGLYREAEYLSQYRLHFGTGCVLTDEDVYGVIEDHMRLPSALVKELQEQLLRGELDEVNRLFAELLAYFSAYSTPNMKFGIHYLFHQVYETVDWMDSNSKAAFGFDQLQLNQRLGECETLEQVSALFHELFASVAAKMSTSKAGKPAQHVAEMKAYIDAHLTDFTLSPNQIASFMNMSTDYVRRQFKREMSMSIMAYMNRERVNKIAAQLRASDKSIDALLGEMGWDNKNYFYKLFKDQYGVTPTEYRSAGTGIGIGGGIGMSTGAGV